MLPFRTEVHVKEESLKISYQTRGLSLGSCFTENIASRLKHYKFNLLINPFGNLYNPLSLYKSLEILLSDAPFDTSYLVYHEGVWSSLMHHTRFSSPDKGLLLDEIEKELETGRKAIRECDLLILTLGTSFYYTHHDTMSIVANCHKLPPASFERKLAGAELITDKLLAITDRLHQLNRRLHVLLTVSPVRHLSDGSFGNQISKSNLFVAAYTLCSSRSHFHYFPAYEIMMDDLRDYRFYADDMLHPSAFAIEYIWEKFAQMYFSESTIETIKKVSSIQSSVAHRPLKESSAMYLTFLEKLRYEIEKLMRGVNGLDLRNEMEETDRKIKNWREKYSSKEVKQD